ncbi:MAG: grasp-with-spasm system ATP-grasp peptide maturase [Bacteroidales bacterium]
MILIFSYVGDISTDLVVEWLNFYQYPVYRINSSLFFESKVSIDINNQNLLIDGQIIQLNKINAIWFRKFGLKKDFKYFKIKNINFKYAFQLHEEHRIVFDTLLYILKDKHWLTNPDKSQLNKGKVLLDALKCGLMVPRSIFTNNRNDALGFLSHSEGIYKSAYDSVFIDKNNSTYTMYTKCVNHKTLTSRTLPDIFSTSLIQSKISKQYEIRIFFLRGTFYSMAIMSQNDTQTRDDFRNYNWERPNRTIPYKLPPKIENKLKRLLLITGLNCASIDMIYDSNGEYIFLEINPVGQFGMIDFPCNYNLNKKIAQELIKMDKI